MKVKSDWIGVVSLESGNDEKNIIIILPLSQTISYQLVLNNNHL
jgi:hypothetical protein